MILHGSVSLFYYLRVNIWYFLCSILSPAILLLNKENSMMFFMSMCCSLFFKKENQTKISQHQIFTYFGFMLYFFFNIFNIF